MYVCVCVCVLYVCVVRVHMCVCMCVCVRVCFKVNAVVIPYGNVYCGTDISEFVPARTWQVRISSSLYLANLSFLSRMNGWVYNFPFPPWVQRIPLRRHPSAPALLDRANRPFVT